MKITATILFLGIYLYGTAQPIKIRQNTKIARIANRFKETEYITFGNTIYAVGRVNLDSLSHYDKYVLRHEAAHCNQYRRFGFLGFIWRYLALSILHGYNHNSLEIKADEEALFDTLVNHTYIITK